MRFNSTIFGVEKWDDELREWRLQRFDCKDLQEVGEVIDLLNEAMPDREFRPAQYNVEEFQIIRSFG